jgi:hypothetical protein
MLRFANSALTLEGKFGRNLVNTSPSWVDPPLAQPRPAGRKTMTQVQDLEPLSKGSARFPCRETNGRFALNEFQGLASRVLLPPSIPSRLSCAHPSSGGLPPSPELPRCPIRESWRVREKRLAAEAVLAITTAAWIVLLPFLLHHGQTSIAHVSHHAVLPTRGRHLSNERQPHHQGHRHSPSMMNGAQYDGWRHFPPRIIVICARRRAAAG